MRLRLNGFHLPAPGSGPMSRMMLLAMAHQKLGHADEARRWLQEAVQAFEKPERQRVLKWADRLEFTLMRQEAEALFKKSGD